MIQRTCVTLGSKSWVMILQVLDKVLLGTVRGLFSLKPDFLRIDLHCHGEVPDPLRKISDSSTPTTCTTALQHPYFCS